MRYFIETERLVLRDILSSDDERMFVLDSDPEVHRYVGNKPVQTIEECRNVIAFIREQYEANGIGRWAVIEKSSGQFIGWSGLKLMKETTNCHVDYLDLGYRFIRQYWGKGYAKETAKAAAGYAWDVLHAKELFGMAEEGNAASRKVLESVGLQYKEMFDWNGRPYAWYSMRRPADE
jgi:RimJ/RimL family protein N-acetyltransferase